MAFAIVSTGFEAGMMIFGPFLQLLLDKCGWRCAQRVLALITFCGGVCGIIVYTELPKTTDKSDRTDTSSGDHDEGEDQTLLRQIETKKEGCSAQLRARFLEICRFYRRPEFILLGISFFCYTWSYDSPYTFLPLRAQSLGISAIQSSTILAIFGLSGIIARLVVLFIPYDNFKITVFATGGCLMAAGVLSICISYFTSYTLLAVYAGLLGSTLGKSFIICLIIFHQQNITCHYVTLHF